MFVVQGKGRRGARRIPYPLLDVPGPAAAPESGSRCTDTEASSPNGSKSLRMSPSSMVDSRLLTCSLVTLDAASVAALAAAALAGAYAHNANGRRVRDG